MSNAIPPAFDDSFLGWFRERTERAWAVYTPHDYLAQPAGFPGGTDWQRGTRWTGGLADDQIDATESAWNLTFPPDYRLFLSRLHATDRPKIGVRYADHRLIPTQRPGFYNWLTDEQAIHEQLEWSLDGLLFDVEHADLWLAEWGPRPDTPEARKTRLRALVASAPRVIPLLGHRYLLGAPNVAGNPVLSVYQSDIIVYGANLRDYLLYELGNLLGLSHADLVAQTSDRTHYDVRSIPFWGAIIARQP